jgi:hypothetical protein
MATRKRRLKEPETLPYLRYIEHLLLTGYGDIMLGRSGNVECAARACDEDQTLATLARRDGETLVQLLTRLDKAIEQAYEHNHIIDEVSHGPDYSI